MTDADRQFYMQLTSLICQTVMGAITIIGGAWGGWIAYLRLKAGQQENAGKLADVKEIVNGHTTALSSKIERLEGVISTAKDAEVERLKGKTD
jgi:hypothetical protein